MHKILLILVAKITHYFLFTCVIDRATSIIVDFLNIGKPNKGTSKNRLLIVRVDGIGDYIIFRNFLESVRKQYSSQEYSITLLGNIAWRELSENLDKDHVDFFIWIDRNKFIKNLIYRIKIIRDIRSCEYSLVINPVYSREMACSDSLVKLLISNQKIGVRGDCSNIPSALKWLSDRYYSKLIHPPEKQTFDFYRNAAIFGDLPLSVELPKKLSININKHNVDEAVSELGLSGVEFAVLFIGGSDRKKRWDTTKFCTMAHFIHLRYKLHIVACGGPLDIDSATALIDLCQDIPFHNLVGKISLVSFCSVLSRATFLISGDSFAPHCAVALNAGVKVFVLYDGRYFGRFAPYPTEMVKDYYLITDPKVVRQSKIVAIKNISSECAIAEVERVIG